MTTTQYHIFSYRFCAPHNRLRSGSMGHKSRTVLISISLFLSLCGSSSAQLSAQQQLEILPWPLVAEASQVDLDFVRAIAGYGEGFLVFGAQGGGKDLNYHGIGYWDGQSWRPTTKKNTTAMARSMRLCAFSAPHNCWPTMAS